MDDITKVLTQIALKNSIPFFYSCYTRAPSVLKREWRGAIGSIAVVQDFDDTFDSLLARLREILNNA